MSTCAVYALDMVDGEPICDRCSHVWAAHSDRAVYACADAISTVNEDGLVDARSWRKNCNCPGWQRNLTPEGF